jgi:hypothetical protein
MERILLETTKLNLSSGYINTPCELEIIAEDVRKKLPINNEYPTMLLRLGYADSALYARRRDVTSVIEL